MKNKQILTKETKKVTKAFIILTGILMMGISLLNLTNIDTFIFIAGFLILFYLINIKLEITRSKKSIKNVITFILSILIILYSFFIDISFLKIGILIFVSSLINKKIDIIE